MLEHYQISIAMLQECGINWNCLTREQQLLSILREKFKHRQCKARTAHNQHEGVNEKSQWGGTVGLSLGAVCRYAKVVGEDPTGLGHWCWARFQGQDGIILRCVSVYGPCKSNNGDRSVWQQHIQFLNNNDDTRSPETAFLEDLEADLKAWLATGDQVIVGGDFNKELTCGPFPAIFQRNNVHNMVFELHSPEDFPSTSNKAKTKKRTMDDIFGTLNLVPVSAGYLPINEFLGDHQPIWFDVACLAALGHPPPKIQHPSRRRLQLQNSKSVKICMDELKPPGTQHPSPNLCLGTICACKSRSTSHSSPSV